VVMDGLRAEAVNPTDAPTMTALRTRGVHFANSHALFPTFTTPNAAAIATGHYPGDTADFSNFLFAGFPVFDGRPASFTGKSPGTLTPFIEENQVLGDIDAPGVDTEIIIRKFGIPDAHPNDAIAEAVRLGTTVSERDIRGRSDFRGLLTVTIDGEHARDFDDAITLEKLAL